MSEEKQSAEKIEPTTNAWARFWFKIPDNLKLIGVFLGVFTALITIFVFFRNENLQKPKFTFSYPDKSGKEEFVIYEVTEGLNAAASDYDLGTIEISVSAIYKGDQFPGPYLIQTVSSTGEVKERGRWSDFNTSKAPIVFYLYPGELYALSGVNSENPKLFYQGAKLVKPDEGQFKIRVADLDDHILAEDTIKVVETPWYHVTTLENSLLNTPSAIIGNVTITNLGQPSEFRIAGNLYDAETADYSTLDGQWDAEKTFGPAIDTFEHVTSGNLAKNETYTFPFEIKRDKLEIGHIYLIETMVYKKLPYLDSPTPQTWKDADQKWRYRSILSYNGLFLMDARQATPTVTPAPPDTPAPDPTATLKPTLTVEPTPTLIPLSYLDLSRGACGKIAHPCTYTVKQGDNPSSIAESIYKDATWATELMLYNRNSDGSMPVLQVGQSIFVPDTKKLPEIRYQICAENKSVFPCQYLAQNNDTFQKVAERFYGDSSLSEFLNLKALWDFACFPPHMGVYNW